MAHAILFSDGRETNGYTQVSTVRRVRNAGPTGAPVHLWPLGALVAVDQVGAVWSGVCCAGYKGTLGADGETSIGWLHVEPEANVVVDGCVSGVERLSI